MVIEMLLNNDIQLFFGSNDFKLSKVNVIMFIIEIFKKVNSNHFILTKFQ